MAINNGFRQDLQERLLGSTSHVNLMRVENDGIHDWQALQQRLEKLPHVKAAAPAIYEQVLISRGARAGGAVLEGHRPRRRAQGDGPAAVGARRQRAAAGAGRRSRTPGRCTLGRQRRLPDAALEGARRNDPNPSSLEGAAERIAAMPPIVLGKDLAETLGAGGGFGGSGHQSAG